MHKEILTTEQVALLPLVASFSKTFGLVGGTAIALHLGHRESIDFDLFTHEPFDTAKIKRKIKTHHTIDRVIRDETGQFTIIANGVHMTFFHYPYPISFDVVCNDNIHVPDLLTLGAMKLFALGRRAKWKDYVDLYFILKDHHTLNEIVQKSIAVFDLEFNEKIVREQLSYFADINYSEEVVYRPGFETAQEEIQAKLTEWSLS